MKRPIGKLFNDIKGGTAIEYGFIVALVVIVMMVALFNLASVTIGMWNNVSDKVSQAN
ncbi:Flp family type IVb pilin [Flavisphingomonas formosensis]|uniref:Flp family type IVb pilin n=1 Tax=Flavisphingomonas formosensis TaxID=861534 RepID=UPI0012F7DE3B|nr:Flp family type IVb pilin [Sphingomonas formosensis]